MFFEQFLVNERSMHKHFITKHLKFLIPNLFITRMNGRMLVVHQRHLGNFGLYTLRLRLLQAV